MAAWNDRETYWNVSLPCSSWKRHLDKRHVDQLLPGAPLRTTAETTVPPVTESRHPSPEIAVEPVVIPEDHLVAPVVIPEVNPVSPGVPADLLPPSSSPIPANLPLPPRRSTRVSKAPNKLKYGLDLEIVG